MPAERPPVRPRRAQRAAHRPPQPARQSVPGLVVVRRTLRRFATGLDALDPVLGGETAAGPFGLCAASLVLLAGVPGVGRTTLALQLAAGCASRAILVLCANDSLAATRTLADRLGLTARLAELTFLAVHDAPAVFAALRRHPAEIVIVDALETVIDPDDHAAHAAFVAHCRDVSRARGQAFLLVTRLAPNGTLRGPARLQYLADTIVHLERIDASLRRVRAPAKSRHGSTLPEAWFELTATGLLACAGPPPCTSRPTSRSRRTR